MKRNNKFLWLLCVFNAYGSERAAFDYLNDPLISQIDLSEKFFSPSKQKLNGPQEAAEQKQEKQTVEPSDSKSKRPYEDLLNEVELLSAEYPDLKKESKLTPDMQDNSPATLKDFTLRQAKNSGIFDYEIKYNKADDEGVVIEGLTKSDLFKLSQEQLNVLEKTIDSLTGKRLSFVAVPAGLLEKQMFVLQAEKQAAVRVVQRVVEPQSINNCGWHSLKNIHERLSNYFKVKPKIFTAVTTEFDDAHFLRQLWYDSMGKLSDDREISLFMLSADLIPAAIEDQTRLFGRYDEYINEIKAVLKRDRVCAVVMYTGFLGENEVNAHWLALTIDLRSNGNLSAVVMDSLGFVDNGLADLEALKIKSKNFKDLHIKPIYYNIDRLKYAPINKLLQLLTTSPDVLPSTSTDLLSDQSKESNTTASANQLNPEQEVKVWLGASRDERNKIKLSQEAQEILWEQDARMVKEAAKKRLEDYKQEEMKKEKDEDKANARKVISEIEMIVKHFNEVDKARFYDSEKLKIKYDKLEEIAKAFFDSFMTVVPDNDERFVRSIPDFRKLPDGTRVLVNDAYEYYVPKFLVFFKEECDKDNENAIQALLKLEERLKLVEVTASLK